MLQVLVLVWLVAWSNWVGAGEEAWRERPPRPTVSTPAAPVNPFSNVYLRLKEQGVSQPFLDALAKDDQLKFDEKFIHANLMNFLSKDDYHVFLTPDSVKVCKAFLKTHSKALGQCEKKFSVPKEVVTALLWVETKHGRDLGRHHLPSVFMNLALADEKDILDRVLQDARERAPAAGRTVEDVTAKVQAAAKRKSAWAIGELVAMDKIRQQHGVDFIQLKGSVSGAFGIPQFIPSSFVSWAADGNGDGKIDLFEPADAICSVASYLKSNGWGESEESRLKAIYHYNRLDEYGLTVLKLAKKLRKRGRKS